MRREAYDKLVRWKAEKNAKPLIILGVRQAGKTWLMKEFGKNEFHQTAYFNFEATPVLNEIFKGGFKIKSILSMLNVSAGFTIDPHKTLIIFDEIQACPQALTALKYFNEEQPQLKILAAGSLLGVALHQGVSFPVGKVDFLNLHPLNFSEFLQAMKQSELLRLLKEKDRKATSVFHDQLNELLRQYFFTGGMPEVVSHFSENLNYQKAREIQLSITQAYERDFSKHAPEKETPRIRMIWNSIVSQLAKENSKFIYSLIRKGARAKDFELAIDWLKDAGLIHKVHRVSKPGFPLKGYADWKDFKIYAPDTGILGALAGLPPEIMMHGNDVFTEFKGIMTEQFVLQQLVSQDTTAFYWAPDSGSAEVDFVIQKDKLIIPLEVKAAENLKSRSLRSYADKYKPKKCFRLSMAKYRAQEWMENLPLYELANDDFYKS